GYCRSNRFRSTRMSFQWVGTSMLLVSLVAALSSTNAWAQIGTRWPQHSLDRPAPPVVDPGPYVAPSGHPSDAVVLFDGKDLSQWRDEKGGAARWVVRDGYAEVAPGTGSMQTAQGFGDVQLHVEWSAPSPPKGEGQD